MRVGVVVRLHLLVQIAQVLLQFFDLIFKSLDALLGIRVGVGGLLIGHSGLLTTGIVTKRAI